jgi:D-alanine-D-alanine ligase
MNNLLCHSDIPVLMLSNLNRQWSKEEIQDSVNLTDSLYQALSEAGHPVSHVCLDSDDLSSLLDTYCPDDLIIFNLCDEIPGIPHSEALVAQELERRGFTYTGADFHALKQGQDKRQVKQNLQKWGIPTPAWQVYNTAQAADWNLFPAIVKPAFEHCSHGITRESVVQSTVELEQRLHFVLEQLHQPALVEYFLDDREFHVGVIGNKFPRVLPPAEIDYSAFEDIRDRLCTYESNFDKTSLAYQVTKPRLPVMLAQDLLRKLNEVVMAAYRATGGRDFARMDIRLHDGIFYVLDVNHNADISPDTSLALTAEIIGYPYEQFGSLLVNLAAQRHGKFRQKWLN